MAALNCVSIAMRLGYANSTRRVIHERQGDDFILHLIGRFELGWQLSSTLSV